MSTLSSQLGQNVETMATSTRLSPEIHHTRRSARVLQTVAVAAALLLITILLQIAGSAYTSELGGYPDEPAHFITGLMIRDYIAAGAPQHPIEYAENYYLHYPKVSFGMWGPLLHLTEAGWMLILPQSRVSVLVLMAIITVASGLLLYSCLLDSFGFVPALTAAVLFVMNPAVQKYTGMVMADGMVAFFDLAAALAFGIFLSTGKWKYSVHYGIFTCLSILSKGNGVALVLLPPMAIVLARKSNLLRRWSLWIGPVVVLCIAGPWQYYSAKMLSGIIDRQAPFAFFPTYTALLGTILGIALVPFAIAGVYSRIVRPWLEHRVEGMWASAASLIFSVWLFHCLVPAAGAETRYFIAVLLPLLMFVTAGMDFVAHKLRFLPKFKYRAHLVAAVLLALFFGTVFSIPVKAYHGFDEIAAMLARPEEKEDVVLVSSEGDGEGLLVSEVAMRDPNRPSHIVLRATKMLSQSNWNAEHYELLQSTPEEVMTYLKSIPVEIVVIDSDRRLAVFPHHELLKKTIAAYPQEWMHVGTFPEQRKGKAPIEVYRLKTSGPKSRGKIRINLPYTLGRTIESGR
jgi:hypothetical protein